jgi:transposase
MRSRRYRLTLFYLFEFEQNVRNRAWLYILNNPGDKTKGDFSLFSFHPQKTIGMKNLIKQVLGIDVAQDELVVCLAKKYDDLSEDSYTHKIFANTTKGFEQLAVWIKKVTDSCVPVIYVMEATGVYHESLAYYLKDQGQLVSIVLPNKISHYARTLNVKTVTDKTASEAIAQFGLERRTDEWQKPSPTYKRIRQLTRERDQIIVERTMVKNELHAENAEAQPNKSSITRCKKRIELLIKQAKEIVVEIAALIKTEDSVNKSLKLICSITGIGMLTAATVLAETNGFDLIRNKRQLTSYAGLDIKDHQSGTSVKGKPKISKRGNRYLRKAMHLPALTAIRHDERFKALFARLMSKHGIKMKAVVAVQRKLLEMTYTIHKSNTKYDKEYFKNKEVVLN